MDVSIQGVVESYLNYLTQFDQTHKTKCFKKLNSLLRADQEAARSEAVVFSWLHSLRLAPEPIDRGESGPDFLCHTCCFSNFYVEATALTQKTIANKSGVSEVLEDTGGGNFNTITLTILRKAIKKIPQLSGLPHPRLIVITGSHHMAITLLCGFGRDLLTGDTVTDADSGIETIPQLYYLNEEFLNSIFFSINGLNVLPDHQTISAILLMAIYNSQCCVVGLIHPEPHMSFDIHLMPNVPFCKFKSWPIINGIIETEWVGSASKPAIFNYSRI